MKTIDSKNTYFQGTAVALRGTARALSGLVRGTLRAHSGHTQGTNALRCPYPSFESCKLIRILLMLMSWRTNGALLGHFWGISRALLGHYPSTLGALYGHLKAFVP